jgi:hypothetical protein
LIWGITVSFWDDFLACVFLIGRFGKNFSRKRKKLKKSLEASDLQALWQRMVFLFGRPAILQPRRNLHLAEEVAVVRPPNGRHFSRPDPFAQGSFGAP